MAPASPPRIIVTGGGTGGHLFPGIAVATELRHRLAGCEIMFIGTDRHIDRDNLADSGFEVKTIQCLGLKGMGLRGKLRSLLRLPAAVWEARRIIRRFQPHLVLGVGGYVTGPVLLAARLCAIPTAIHEQNSLPGLANRLTAKLVDRIFLSIPCNYPFAPHKTILTGNPVRREILAAAQKHSGQPGDKVTILVLGGSQGAHRVNELMLETAVELQAQLGERLQLIHQTGQTDQEAMATFYAQKNITAQCAAFFRNMAELYHRADLVVSRAGATTLAELSVMGLPALLIPYPYAADNHQEINGRYYVEGGGALMVREADATPAALVREIATLLHNRDKLHTMGDNMKKLGKPQATEAIVAQCLDLMARK